MRRMTATAAFCLDRQVLEDKWPLFVRMTLEANRIPIRERFRLSKRFRAVHVVAVGALDQTFVDPVPVGPAKFRFRRGVTAETQLRLRLDKEVLFSLPAMR